MKQSHLKKFHAVVFVLAGSCFLLLAEVCKAQKRKTIPKLETKKQPLKIVSFEVLENGDTINQLDNQQQRQGKWLIETPARYDEPAFFELGYYSNNVRAGSWKSYSYDGILLAEENYKNNLKNGEARYFDNGALICVGNYYALNATHKYDTILVESGNGNDWKTVVVPSMLGSVRHGLWTFYDPKRKKINRVVEYQADEIIYDKEYNQLSKADSMFIEQKIKSYPHLAGKESSEGIFGKQKRERIRYTDFPDDIQYVKPNVRKK